jgi:hypothetical protein
MTGEEQFLKRPAADSNRYEAILDTWEKQQRQYQRYLFYKMGLIG